MTIINEPATPMTTKERIMKLKYDHNLRLEVSQLDKLNEGDLRQLLSMLIAHCEKRR